MQDAETGTVSTHIGAWKKMREKKPDPKKPQPQAPEYYGRSEEAVNSYCTAFQGFHPEVDDPLSEEVDERSVYIYIHGTTCIYFHRMFLLGMNNNSFRDAGRWSSRGTEGRMAVIALLIRWLGLP